MRNYSYCLNQKVYWKHSLYGWLSGIIIEADDITEGQNFEIAFQVQICDPINQSNGDPLIITTCDTASLLPRVRELSNSSISLLFSSSHR